MTKAPLHAQTERSCRHAEVSLHAEVRCCRVVAQLDDGQAVGVFLGHARDLQRDRWWQQHPVIPVLRGKGRDVDGPRRCNLEHGAVALCPQVMCAVRAMGVQHIKN